MLLILESVPVCNETVHSRARRALLEGYLQANVKDHRPPRFLLNDLVRYWRTIAILRARCALAKVKVGGSGTPSSGCPARLSLREA
jgi:hypothetical protein